MNEADAPATLTLGEHRDRQGKRWHVWIRRALLYLLGLILLAALLNAFGQRPTTSSVAVPSARLQVFAPTRVRSGLIYAARFRVDARRELKDARLVLAPGWADAYTVNGLSPQPASEASSNGSLSYSFGHIPAGQHLTFFLSLQVNPTNVGRHTQTVVLADGSLKLARKGRDLPRQSPRKKASDSARGVVLALRRLPRLAQ